MSGVKAAARARGGSGSEALAIRPQKRHPHRGCRRFERCARPSFSRTLTGNLDFDAKVPIPFSIFPSTYKNEEVKAEQTTGQQRTRVEAEVTQERVGGRQERVTSFEANFPSEERPGRREDVRIYEQRDRLAPEVEVTREKYRETRVGEPYQGRTDVQIDIEREPRRTYRDNRQEVVYDRETELDITERQYRQRVQQPYENVYDVEYSRRYPGNDRYYEKDTQVNYDVEYSRRTPGQDRVYEKDDKTTLDVEYERRRPGTVRFEEPPVQERVTAETEVVYERPTEETKKMGYYDDEGQYHSFRRGLERAADRIVHPFSHHSNRAGGGVTQQREEITIDERVSAGPSRSNVRYVERERSANTVTIPCHHIRIGDILVLQGRPSQVIRITTSAQTGQHRYLGVDLFTKQLHEESSFVSNPEPSVIVQTMLGPVFKEYRVLDLRRDGRVVAMTETGDVKQGLPIIDQNNLFDRIDDAFADGRGSVRVLVINDGGRELAVDYKVIHGSRL